MTRSGSLQARKRGKQGGTHYPVLRGQQDRLLSARLIEED